ncbi:hypothetical protein C8R45DRAFT_1031073 [Mycena sanguinolenta]|nr:hypothetical protein C8R45DRAFT_1031073 [Mycena sanguinolenta]
MCLPYWHSRTAPSIRISSSVHAPCRPAPVNRYAAARFRCSTRPVPPCSSVIPASPDVPRPQRSASRVYRSRARATSSPPLDPHPIRSPRHPNPLRLFSTLTTSYAPLTQSRARFPCCLPLPASALRQCSILPYIAFMHHLCTIATPLPRSSTRLPRSIVPLSPPLPAAAVVLAPGTSRLDQSMCIFPFSDILTCSVWGHTRSSAAHCNDLDLQASPEAISRPSSLRLSQIHRRRFFVSSSTATPPSRPIPFLACRPSYLSTSCVLVGSSTFHSSLCGLSHIHRTRGASPPFCPRL